MGTEHNPEKLLDFLSRCRISQVGERERQEPDPGVCLKESGPHSCPRVPIEEKVPDSVGLFQ